MIYNAASGQTHLLDSLSAAALEAFERSSWTAQDLSAYLAKTYALDGSEVYKQLSGRLAEFERLGLLEPDRT